MIAYSNPNTRILDQLSINSISQKVDQNYKALTDQHTRLLDKNRQQKSQIQEMSKHNQMLNAELEKADNDYKMLHDLFQKQRNGLFLLQKFEPILKSIQAFKKKGDTYELYVLPEDAEKLFKVILESQSISWDGFNMFEKTDMNVGADSGNSKN